MNSTETELTEDQLVEINEKRKRALNTLEELKNKRSRVRNLESKENENICQFCASSEIDAEILQSFDEKICFRCRVKLC